MPGHAPDDLPGLQLEDRQAFVEDFLGLRLEGLDPFVESLVDLPRRIEVRLLDAWFNTRRVEWLSPEDSIFRA